MDRAVRLDMWTGTAPQPGSGHRTQSPAQPVVLFDSPNPKK